MLYEEVTDYTGDDMYGYIQPVDQLAEPYLYFTVTAEAAKFVFADVNELGALPADAPKAHTFAVELNDGQLDMHNLVDQINIPGDYPMQKRELRLLPSYLLANYFDVLDDAEDDGIAADFALQRNEAATLSTRYGIFIAATPARATIMRLL